MGGSDSGVIRAAKCNESELLSEIAIRSKAYWRYTEEFMASCREELRVTAALIDANPAFVAEDAGVVVGYYILERRSVSNVELEHLFVDPPAIGCGYGRRLMKHAVAEAAAASYLLMEIQADPYAEAFYLAMGAIRVGAKSSRSIPDRELPLLQINCDRPGRRLVRPSTRFRQSFLEMAREFGSEGDPRYSLALSDVDAYLTGSQRWAAGTDLPPDRVPMDEWWLLDGHRVLGGSRLRHRLTPGLELDGGHIGYDIRPSERRRGNGNRILDLMLAKAISMGLDRVLITCETTNQGSIRIIESAGGIPISNSISPNTGKEMLRFWISIAAPRS